MKDCKVNGVKHNRCIYKKDVDNEIQFEPIYAIYDKVIDKDGNEVYKLVSYQTLKNSSLEKS